MNLPEKIPLEHLSDDVQELIKAAHAFGRASVLADLYAEQGDKSMARYNARSARAAYKKMWVKAELSRSEQ